MRILIEDGLSSERQLTGIGHHSIQLWNSLRQIVQCDLSNYDYLKGFPRIVKRIAYLGIMNYQSVNSAYDIIHYQNYYTPFLKTKGKKIATIHDLVAFRYPETLPQIYCYYNKLSITRAVQNCDAIFTRSHSVRNELLLLFPKLHPSNVYVCDGGLRDIFLSSSPDSKRLGKYYLLPFSYFLYVGDLLGRKNLSFLLNAFIDAKRSNKIQKETTIVLVGKHAWDSWEFKHLIKEELGIKTVGYIPENDLVSFYKYCKGVIYPSIYEGYGLPLLEAMSQQAPIVISNIPTNNEINQLHNNQMAVFDLGDSDRLTILLRELDENSGSIGTTINYGDLSCYLYENVARRHLEFYQKIVG